jgi:phosphatidate cytidylyltransferase
MVSELTKRVAVAAVGIPLAVLLIYLGGWLLGLFIAALAAAAAVELYRIAEQRAVRPFRASGAVLAALFVLVAAAWPSLPDAGAWSMHLLLAGTLLLATFAIFARGVSGAPLTAVAVTIFGAVFTGLTLATAIHLREWGAMGAPPAGSAAEVVLRRIGAVRGGESWPGALVLLFPLLMTWASDTFAYFGGRAFGRRKLIPAVSPAKTVEGAVSGVIGTVIVAAVYAHFVLGSELGLPFGALSGAAIGLVVSPVAQAGDLAESLLKREAGVKDSGALLPGHGGVLDRFDSLFFTIPVTYWLMTAAVGMTYFS